MKRGLTAYYTLLFLLSFLSAPPASAQNAAASPEATLASYMEAMRTRNASPDIYIYSNGTRAMLAEWVMTSAQMNNVERAYRDCAAEPALYGPLKDRAVIRYRLEDRHCSPWFFVYEDEGWRLDLTMMQHAIRFGGGNAWRLIPNVAHPYTFAFEDWRFDRNGFPTAAFGQ